MTEISVLLYPTTLVTKFVPAFFTQGRQLQQNFNAYRAIISNLAAVVSGVSALNLDEDTLQSGAQSDSGGGGSQKGSNLHVSNIS